MKKIKVRYICDDSSPLACIKGKIYEVISIEHGMYRVIDETGEDYLYSPSSFEIVKLYDAPNLEHRQTRRHIMEIQKPKNEKEAEVIALLKNKFLDEPHFINGIMMSLKNSDDCQSMIDEINNGNVATPEDAILFALQIELYDAPNLEHRQTKAE